MRLALSLARRIRKGPLSGPELRSPRQPCGCALSLSIHSALHPKMQSALSPRIACAKAARFSLARRIRKRPPCGPESCIPRQPCGCATRFRFTPHCTKMQSALSPRIARASAKAARSSLARRIRKGPLCGPELHVPRQPCGCALSLSLHSALHPKMQSALSPRIACASAKAARSSLARRIRKGPLSGPELRSPR